MGAIEIIALIGLIINAAVMLTGIIGLFVAGKHFIRQQQLSFFEKYTARYSHIMEQMPEEFFLTPEENIPDDTLKEINHYIRLYLDLCSEEYYLHQEGCIDEKVWEEEWKDGITGLFGNPFVKDYWEKNEQVYSESYKSFCVFVDEVLNKKTV